MSDKLTFPPPSKVTACEACVYGKGEHAEWCREPKKVKVKK